MLKRSLVGYDGSASSQRALRFAIDLARAFGGRVRVVMALQSAVGNAEVLAALMVDEGARRASELLEELRAAHPDAAGLLDVDLESGNPGDVLIEQVAKHAIDHIVIGHTESGALARWLVGSVSTDVLERAHVPMTIVR